MIKIDYVNKNYERRAMSTKNYLLFFALGFSSMFMSQEMYAMNAAFPLLVSSDLPQKIDSMNELETQKVEIDPLV